jgi:hypothetical protein
MWSYWTARVPLPQPELALPVMGFEHGRMTFERPAVVINRPAEHR